MKFLIAEELQKRWMKHPPNGWLAAKEMDLLSVDERKLLGYRPLVDLVLTNRESKHHIWIEIEVSRADPVANHAKFASAHLLNPISHEDAFVSLMSNHVTRGKANLAAHTVYLMRTGGIRAFQMPLLGDLTGVQISGINQGRIPLSQLPTPSLEEVIGLTRPLAEDVETEIYYTTNKLEVILNVRQWNSDAQNDDNKTLWGCRRVKYFVFDNKTGLFAPSKFCAYTRMKKASPDSCPIVFNPSMTISAYSKVPQDYGIFDGQKAWKRLSRIGFRRIKAASASSFIRDKFTLWLRVNSSLLRTDPRECELLLEI